MGEIKQIIIKNRTYYFYNDRIDLNDFDAKLLKIEKKDYNEIDIYYIGYVTVKKIANCNNNNSVNPLYLMVNEMIGHFEEINRNNYLDLDDVGENKQVSKNMKKFGKVLKENLKQLMVVKKLNMAKILEKFRLERIGLNLTMICH